MDGRSARLQRELRRAGGISLLVAPLGLITGWAIAYTSVSDFFSFAFESPYLSSGKSDSAERFLSIISGPDGGFRLVLLPHYFVYAAMPIFIAAAMYLAFVLFRRAPWHALAGVVLTSIGAVFFVGVLGAWLSFPAIANVPADQATNLQPVVQALTTPQGALLVSTMLSVLVFLGMAVFGFGLYKSRIVPRWSAALVAAGNLLILAFAGTENWMTIGAVLMLVGLLPLSLNAISGPRTAM
ncbi:DUF4386 family protein [Actinoplanes sp. NPDC051475]|uniref:DUF4386 family protein n=1 Tax=Actinoplanes sp. NPDC051475 TaxID=3157225 RepID=UPI00344D20EE